MKPLTELDLRLALKNSDVNVYSVPMGTVVTPAASEYLKSQRIELVYEEEASAPGGTLGRVAPPLKWDFSARSAETDAPEKVKQFFFGPDGGTFDHKPESLTHLKGRQLVHKNHPLIIWRGKLDSLAARIIEAQLVGSQLGEQEYVDDLQEILEFIRQLLTCELRGKEVDDFNLLGLDSAALRERSHNPLKFFGHHHMLADYQMGPLCVALNSLRTLVREVELAAAAAFDDAAGQSTRDDIIRALNMK